MILYILITYTRITSDRPRLYIYVCAERYRKWIETQVLSENMKMV